MRGRRDGAALAREYLDALAHQRRLAPATVRNYGRALELLLALLGEADPAAVESAQVRRLVARLRGLQRGEIGLAQQREQQLQRAAVVAHRRRREAALVRQRFQILAC